MPRYRFVTPAEVVEHESRRRRERWGDRPPQAPPTGKYRVVERGGGWWAVEGPDGHQVGTAKRSREAAVAALEQIRGD